MQQRQQLQGARRDQLALQLRQAGRMHGQRLLAMPVYQPTTQFTDQRLMADQQHILPFIGIELTNHLTHIATGRQPGRSDDRPLEAKLLAHQLGRLLGTHIGAGDDRRDAALRAER